MDKDKNNSYRLTGSIHTSQILSTNVLKKDIVQELKKEHVITRFSTDADGVTHRITFNLNNIAGDILTFKEFTEVLEDTLARIGVTEYEFLRVDFRADSYEDGFYEKFYKINSYLMNGMITAYDIKNSYETRKKIYLDKLSCSAKHKWFELEYYNRREKSIITGNTTERAVARLEMRTKSAIWEDRREQYPKKTEFEHVKDEFLSGWKKRLSCAVKNLDDSCVECNKTLEELYNKENQQIIKKASPVRFRSLTDFLIFYEPMLYTLEQTQELLKVISDKEPEKASYNHSYRYRPELFTKQDINDMVKEVNRCISQYFSE